MRLESYTWSLKHALLDTPAREQPGCRTGTGFLDRQVQQFLTCQMGVQ